MKISIVIPVYNEAEQLEACLLAIARQTAAPYEVIVVDNNSDDDTILVARKFGFARLLREPKQGVLHARTRGFDAARGEVIARIDADSVLPPDWVETVQAVMADKSIAASSGTAHYYNVAAAPLFNAIDLFFRRRLSRQLGDRLYLWGANMAMRRDAWYQVKPRLCNQARLHEDYDIAIHLQELGYKVTFDERLRAAVSSRRIDVGYINFMRYVLVSPNTYARHRLKRRFYMYEVVIICAIGYLPARLLHRGYDPGLQKFSWLKLLSAAPRAPRVDPTSNIA